MNKIIPFILLITFTACSVTVPAPAPFVTIGGTTIPLHGEGIRKATLFAVKIYQAAFYCAEKITTLQEAIINPEPKRLEFRYFRDFSLEDTVIAWKYQFRESSGMKPGALASEMSLLASFLKPIQEGDLQEFVLLGENTTFLINGVKQGEIPGAQFQKALLTVFLGPNPPTKELRAGLLREKE